MKIVIEATEQIVDVNGAQARVWTGVTSKGVRVQVLVSRIAVQQGEDMTQFDAELKERKIPAPVERAFPLRLLLD